MSMHYRKIFILNKSVPLILMAAVILFYIKTLKGYIAPFIIPDEFGYEAIAAYFAGHDWTAAAIHVPWYNYGYSLLLAPVYAILKPDSWYKAAQYVNVATLICLLYIMNLVLAKYVSRRPLRYIIVGVLALYPALVFDIRFSWPEPVIFVVPWLVACLIDRCMLDNSRIGYPIIAGFILAAGYFLHARLIVVTFVGLLCLMYGFHQQKAYRKLAVHLSSFVLTFTAGLILKDHIIHAVYHNSVSGSQDSIWKESGTILQRLGDAHSIAMIFAVACGQLAYILIATLGLAGPGIYKLLGMASDGLRRGNLSESLQTSFFILAALGGLSLSVIAIGSDPLYPHHVFYGRYTDEYVLPLFAFGLVLFNENKKRAIVPYIVSVVSCLIAVHFAMMLARRLPQAQTYWSAIAGIFSFRSVNWHLNEHHLILTFAVVSLFLGLLLYIRPKLGAMLVLVAMLVSSVDVTSAMQIASSQHYYKWHILTRVDGASPPREILYVADHSDGLFLRTEAQLMNPASAVIPISQADLAHVPFKFRPHYVIDYTGESAVQYMCPIGLLFEKDECSQIPAHRESFSVSFHYSKKSMVVHNSSSSLVARQYYFITTFPYLRWLTRSLLNKQIRIKFNSVAPYSSFVTVKSFLTNVDSPKWLAQSVAYLYLPRGHAEGSFQVSVPNRGSDGNPLAPGKYDLHVVLCYPDGCDWNVHLKTHAVIN